MKLVSFMCICIVITDWPSSTRTAHAQKAKRKHPDSIKPIPVIDAANPKSGAPPDKFQLRAANLPSSFSDVPESVETLPCGSAHEIGIKGHIWFNFDSQDQTGCNLTFSGSKLDRCTVAFACSDDLVMTPANENKVCDKERIKITDGTGGYLGGCGTMRFQHGARVAKTGHDLYIQFTKYSPTIPCVVFCSEDLNEETHAKAVTKIPEKKSFTGYQTDSNCTCGKKRSDKGRVVGGITAKKFEFPWMAGITFTEEAAPGFNRVSFCGASVINDRYILSAAHCFIDPKAEPALTPENLNVLLHSHLMDKSVDAADDDPAYAAIPGWSLPELTDEEEESQRFEVEQIIIHPLYHGKKTGFDYDVALVKTKTKMNFDDKSIGPICLPNVGEEFNLENGDLLTISGWGLPIEGSVASSRFLQKLDVEFTKYDECLKYIKARSRHLCAGFTEGGKDACQGDSGGPLIKKMEGVNQYMQLGIVSAGRGCARKDALGVYTNLEEVSQWIYHQTSDAVWCLKNQFDRSDENEPDDS